MGNQLDHQRILSEIEVSFDTYFDKYVTPHIRSAKKVYDHDKLTEKANFGYHQAHAEDFWYVYGDRLGHDQKLAMDFDLLTNAWRDTVVDKIGKDEYMRLSHQCPTGDLAVQYMTERLHAKTWDYVGKLNTDKSKINYVVSGVYDSVLGNFARTLEGRGETAGDEMLRHHTEMNTSLGLRVVKDTASVAADIAIWRCPKWSIMDGIADASQSYGKEQGSVVDRLVGKAVLGNANGMEQFRKEAKTYNYPGNQHMESINENLTRPVFQYFNNSNIRKDTKLLNGQANGDLEKMALMSLQVQASIDDVKHIPDSIHDVFKKEISEVPKWVREKKDNELQRLASKFASIAADMRQKGQKEVILSGKKMKYQDVVNRCKLYDLALMDRGITVTDKDYTKHMNAVGLIAYGGITPDWIRQKSDKDLMGATAYYTSTFSEMEKKGLSKIQLQKGQNSFSRQEINQRVYFMSRECLRRGTASRAAAEKASRAAATSMQTASASQSTNSTPAGQTTDQVTQQYQQSQQKVGAMSAQTDAWGGFMKQLGLDGLSGLGDNLGYTLAMLPDMLFGMLTGQNTHMRLDKAAFPLLMIFGGIFMNNPILKYMMIGLGGMNILNQGQKEAIARDEQERRAVTSYKRYPEEPLDPRIQFNGIKGNSLVVAIDGNPYVVQLDDDTIDSYERGAVSQSALCNAVLRTYDETAHVSRNERYEQAISAHENERVIQEVALK